MSIFAPPVNRLPYVKLQAYGEAGSGKTRFLADVALGLHKRLALPGPVLFLDTEDAAADLKRVVFGPAGVPFESRATRDLGHLIEGMREAVASHGILLADSITHFHEAHVLAFKLGHGVTVERTEGSARAWIDVRPLTPAERAEIKATWRDLVGDHLESDEAHYLIAGRASAEYASELDAETQRRESYRSGIRMRSDADSAYQVGLVVRLERHERTDVAGRVAEVWREAIVEKDRRGAVDGATFRVGPGQQVSVWERLAPSIEKTLADAGPSRARSSSPGPGALASIFAAAPRAGGHAARAQAKAETLGEVEALLSLAFPGGAKDVVRARDDLVARVFGKLSSEHRSGLEGEVLAVRLEALRRELAKSQDERVRAIVAETSRDLAPAALTPDPLAAMRDQLDGVIDSLSPVASVETTKALTSPEATGVPLPESGIVPDAPEGGQAIGSRLGGSSPATGMCPVAVGVDGQTAPASLMPATRPDGPPGEPRSPREAEGECSTCGARLVFSSRRRGDGLCGPCSRVKSGETPTVPTKHAPECLATASGKHWPGPTGSCLACGPDGKGGLGAPVSDEERARARILSDQRDQGSPLSKEAERACDEIDARPLAGRESSRSIPAKTDSAGAEGMMHGSALASALLAREARSSVALDKGDYQTIVSADVATETAPCSPACWARVTCTLCRLTKPPRGRSVAIEALGSYCHDECEGYALAPKAPHLWDEHDGDRAYTDPEGWRAHEAACDRCRPESEGEPMSDCLECEAIDEGSLPHTPHSEHPSRPSPFPPETCRGCGATVALVLSGPVWTLPSGGGWFYDTDEETEAEHRAFCSTACKAKLTAPPAKSLECYSCGATIARLEQGWAELLWSEDGSSEQIVFCSTGERTVWRDMRTKATAPGLVVPEESRVCGALGHGVNKGFGPCRLAPGHPDPRHQEESGNHDGSNSEGGRMFVGYKPGTAAGVEPGSVRPVCPRNTCGGYGVMATGEACSCSRPAVLTPGAFFGRLGEDRGAKALASALLEGDESDSATAIMSKLLARAEGKHGKARVGVAWEAVGGTRDKIGKRRGGSKATKGMGRAFVARLPLVEAVMDRQAPEKDDVEPAHAPSAPRADVSGSGERSW